jgi:hypothetical protein
VQLGALGKPGRRPPEKLARRFNLLPSDHCPKLGELPYSR